MPDTAGPAQLWLPLAQTAGGYQILLNTDWEHTGHAECVFDSRYNAPMLRTTWEGQETKDRQVRLTQVVAVRDRAYPWVSVLAHRSGIASSLLPMTEVERKFWSAPTESFPVDGILLTTATRITAGKITPRERLRAIYDWVVDHTHRDPDTPGCGTGDIKGMLEHGQFGGKCADINGLMVGLARAAGFPAREVYGIRVAPSRFFTCIGAKEDISKAQHCRAEVFLDEMGWFPVDPADVVKVIAVEKLAVDSPEARSFRDHQFGSWEMNWVGYNSATDIELPGGMDRKPGFPFFMYPWAFTSKGNYSGIDPARFPYYEQTAREVSV